MQTQPTRKKISYLLEGVGYCSLLSEIAFTKYVIDTTNDYLSSIVPATLTNITYPIAVSIAVVNTGRNLVLLAPRDDAQKLVGGNTAMIQALPASVKEAQFNLSTCFGKSLRFSFSQALPGVLMTVNFLANSLPGLIAGQDQANETGDSAYIYVGAAFTICSFGFYILLSARDVLQAFAEFAQGKNKIAFNIGSPSTLGPTLKFAISMTYRANASAFLVTQASDVVGVGQTGNITLQVIAALSSIVVSIGTRLGPAFHNLALLNAVEQNDRNRLWQSVSHKQKLNIWIRAIPAALLRSITVSSFFSSVVLDLSAGNELMLYAGISGSIVIGLLTFAYSYHTSIQTELTQLALRTQRLLPGNADQALESQYLIPQIAQWLSLCLNTANSVALALLSGQAILTVFDVSSRSAGLAGLIIGTEAGRNNAEYYESRMITNIEYRLTKSVSIVSPLVSHIARGVGRLLRGSVSLARGCYQGARAYLWLEAEMNDG